MTLIVCVVTSGCTLTDRLIVMVAVVQAMYYCNDFYIMSIIWSGI